jgi:3'(2'), 5'-bisphosphate nucleotidase
LYDPYQEEARIALQAVRIATDLCRKVQQEMITPALSKHDRSPVTVADFASQAVIAKLISDRDPGSVLVGEEDSSALRTNANKGPLEDVTRYVGGIYPGSSPAEVCDWIDFGAADPVERFWVVDPIDGTKGFLRGDQYVVALALIEHGEIVLGALGCPNLDTGLSPDVGGDGSFVLAVRDAGAWVYGGGATPIRRLAVSGIEDPCEARILRSFASEHTDLSRMDHIAQALGIPGEPIAMDSQAKYAVLASGGGDLIFRLLSPDRPDYEEKIWDQAAGMIIVQEAGGRVTDLHGERLDFTQGRTLRKNVGVLASNRVLHDKALAAVRSTRAIG